MTIIHYILIALEVILIFNLIIGVHELGHFLAARWRGLKVERFAIWFGKPVWKKKIGGVEYALGPIPFGGYVSLPQMATMEAIEGKTDTTEPLPNVSPLDKIIVAFAGPLFSFLLAILFAVVVWKVGKPANDADQKKQQEAVAERAKALQQAAAGAERDVAQRAELHIAMCDRRLRPTAVSFGTAEEYYTYGVALINARNVAEARTQLEKALAIAPGSEHIHYALALAQALAGDLAGAQVNLRRAIELEPRNRQLARQDADFAPLAHQAPFRSLLYPDKKAW